jgi:3-oxoadipate enol-lactonase
MPFTTGEDGVRIHYQTFGDPKGEPLLLVQGLGADHRGWMRQRRAVRDFFAIALDNRGVGGSDKPDGPYDLEVMARDALAVLDDLGVERAHVMGASMGGVLAQILGVRHPERVRSLVLACTGCQHLAWRRELLTEWAETASERGMRALVDEAAKWLVGPRSRFRFWPVLTVLGPLALQVPPRAFVAQIEAILSLDDAVRFELPGVTAPTLAVVGSQDILTPLADSEEIVSLIPGAELAVVGGGAHGFMFEHAAAFNRVVLDFLLRQVGTDEQLAA